jgi:hypothetical protein
MHVFANPLRLDEIIFVNYPFMEEWLNNRDFFNTSLNKKILNKIVDKYLYKLDEIKDARLKAYQLYNKKLIEKKEEVKKVIDKFLIFFDGLGVDESEGIPFKIGYDWLTDRISIVKKVYEFARKDEEFKNIVYWPKTPIVEMPILIEEKPRFCFDFVMEDVNKSSRNVFSTSYINYNPNYKFYSSLVYLNKAKEYLERKNIKNFGDFGLSDEEYLRYCIALSSVFLPLARDSYVFEEFDIWKVIEKNIKEHGLKGISIYAIKGSWIKYLEKLAKRRGLKLYYIGNGILRNENFRSQEIFKREMNNKALKVFYSFVKGIFKKEKEDFKNKTLASPINFFECPYDCSIICCIENCKKYKQRCMLDLINDEKFFSKLEKKVYRENLDDNIKLMGIENLIILLNTHDFDVLDLNNSSRSWKRLIRDSLLIPFPFYKFKKIAVGEGKNYLKASDLTKKCQISRLISKFDLKRLEEIAMQEGIRLEKRIEALVGNVRHKIIVQQHGYILDNFVLKNFLEEKNNAFISLPKNPYYYTRAYYCEKPLVYRYKDICVYGKPDAALFVEGKNRAIAILDVKQRYKESYLKQLMVYGLALKQSYVGLDNFFLIVAQLKNTLPYFYIYSINLNDKGAKDFVDEIHIEILETIEKQNELLNNKDFFFELKQNHKKARHCENCLDKDYCDFIANKISTTLSDYVNENRIFKQKIRQE